MRLDMKLCDLIAKGCLLCNLGFLEVDDSAGSYVIKIPGWIPPLADGANMSTHE